jgi:UDP-glucose 4-epimerase
MKALLDGGESRKYNLGNGRGYSNLQVVQTARDVTGHPIPHEIGPRRPGDPAILIASSETINHDLDWRPQYPDLKTIIQTAWNWHLAHPDGYEK